jgi:hypothetical protein
MTKNKSKPLKKNAGKVRNSKIVSCAIYQKMLSVSEDTKFANRCLKAERRRLKRQAAAEKRRRREAEDAKNSNNGEVVIARKRQPPPPPKVKIPIRKLCDDPLKADISQTLNRKLWYSGKELRVLYPWLDKAPEIAPQAKSQGGQCAYQAHFNLMNSIDSIATNPNPKQKRFVDHVQIRNIMSKTVTDVLALLEAEKIPLDQYKSHHLYPGDKDLISFSVHAFLAMGGKLTPYRYKEMRAAGGMHYGLLWLLRQSAGYFIVYGNRLPIEDVNKPAYGESFHYLAVNIKKRLVIDNKSTQTFLRLSQEAFDLRMKTVHTILALEKQDGAEWKIDF